MTSNSEIDADFAGDTGLQRYFLKLKASQKITTSLKEEQDRAKAK